MSENRIAHLNPRPNEMLAKALELRKELLETGLPDDATRHVVRDLIETLMVLSSASIPERPAPPEVKEFVAVVAYNTSRQPVVQIAHTSYVANNRASDLGMAYGIVSAFAQYFGTSILVRHTHPDDMERALKDFYQLIEAHVAQFRQSEEKQNG